MRITDGALVAAATLSNRYITSRQLPDKAIDLIDESASRLRMEIDSSPEEIDQLRRDIDRMTMQAFALEKEDGRRLQRALHPADRANWPTPRRSCAGSRPAGRPRSRASTGSATSRSRSTSCASRPSAPSARAT